MIQKISIKGFRGFGNAEEISFALPNGENGSGITCLVGANNSGKTSIIESIRAFNGSEKPGFSVGKRNVNAGDKIELILYNNDGSKITIRTVDEGGSSTIKEGELRELIYVLQSRRFVEYEFGGGGSYSRDIYLNSYSKLESKRNSQLYGFPQRLFEIQKNKVHFDCLLKELLGENINWTIDQNDSGNYYVKYSFSSSNHSSEGIGDGIWSIFTICDALYDSKASSTIVIDEPELSLHPTIQKRLMNMFCRYAKDRQIIISTHSPYFINWDSIVLGGGLTRVFKDNHDNIKCCTLSEDVKECFKGIIQDANNPHVLGLQANEVFFLQDNIILVEGQEDVVIFNRILKQIKKSFNGNFFGWGVGGAAKMLAFLKLFNNLGYEKVVAIYDGDKKVEMESDRKKFSNYHFLSLPVDDIRDKEERHIKAKNGLTDTKGMLKSDYSGWLITTINSVNDFFSK